MASLPCIGCNIHIGTFYKGIPGFLAGDILLVASFTSRPSPFRDHEYKKTEGRFPLCEWCGDNYTNRPKCSTCIGMPFFDQWVSMCGGEEEMRQTMEKMGEDPAMFDHFTTTVCKRCIPLDTFMNFTGVRDDSDRQPGEVRYQGKSLMHDPMCRSVGTLLANYFFTSDTLVAADFWGEREAHRELTTERANHFAKNVLSLLTKITFDDITLLCEKKGLRWMEYMEKQGNLYQIAKVVKGMLHHNIPEWPLTPHEVNEEERRVYQLAMYHADDEYSEEK